jgi:hypothetical protein
MNPITRLSGAAIVVALFAVACAPSAGTGELQQSQGSPPNETTPPSTATSVPIDQGSCPPATGATPWADDIAVHTEVIQDGDSTTPRIEATRYPHPSYEGKPWSQWGQGLVTRDGRFLSAIGDHIGPDGNSFIYVFEPDTGELRLISDVLSHVEHQPGEFGFGKIHAQMVQGPCGEVFVSTYWGTRRNLTYTETYRGDHLLAIDPSAETVRAITVVQEEHGVPSLATSQDGRLLYAEAVNPLANEKQGKFVVIDVDTDEKVFSDSDALNGFRAIAVDARGRAYYSVGSGKLRVYDPDTNSATDYSVTIPGEFLRAATEPDADGVVYAVTKNPAQFFTLEPAGTTRDLGSALDYTASLALDQGTSTVYWVPGAHGRSWTMGSPLMALDTRTGEQSIVVKLDPLVREAMGLRVSGTYAIAIDAEAKRLFIGMNVSEEADDSGFGDVILVVVTLP